MVFGDGGEGVKVRVAPPGCCQVASAAAPGGAGDGGVSS